MYTERERRVILFLFLFTRICNRRIIIKIQEKACLNVRKFEHECFFCVIIFCEQLCLGVAIKNRSVKLGRQRGRSVMTRNGFFTGLDIGTSSIKVLVAELVNGEVNVIGVSNAKSKGVKDGIIVDIEAAATAIKSAISQAEEKAGISIKSVNVGLPANLLQVEPTQGMIPVTSDTKEITDQDVENVVKSALTKSMTPDREVITFIPEEFVVDGFQGIRDPRGMMGVRLEMRGLLYTGPRTIRHTLG